MGDRKADALTEKLTIRLPKGLMARLQLQAARERRKLADFVRLKLEECDRFVFEERQP